MQSVLASCCEPQASKQTPQSTIVQGLQDALYSTIKEIKVVKKENKSLLEQIVLLEAEQRKDVSRVKKSSNKRMSFFKDM